MGAIDASLLARTRPLDALIRLATTRFPVLASVTPKNAAVEHARLVDAWSRGEEPSPEWIAPTVDRALLEETRRTVDDAIARLARGEGFAAVYRARLLEIATELAIAEAAFGPGLRAAADARFGGDPEIDVREADALADEWLATAPVESDERTVPTDDPNDPRSLLSRMRARLSELRLPVRVIVRPRVGSLAAAGDGVVVVAAARNVSPREIDRVIVHEIEGHVLPRERGRLHPPGIHTLGSARASEDEEGRALLLEERFSLLGPERARTLAARHRAASMVLSGATFVEVVRALRAASLPLESALSVAERVMRGGVRRGSDVVSGAARERVYLPAFVRVRREQARDPSLLDRLGSRRLSLAAWRLLG